MVSSQSKFVCFKVWPAISLVDFSPENLVYKSRPMIHRPDQCSVEEHAKCYPLVAYSLRLLIASLIHNIEQVRLRQVDDPNFEIH